MKDKDESTRRLESLNLANYVQNESRSIFYRKITLIIPRRSYVSKREGCCELQTGLYPPNDLLSVRKCRKRPCMRSFPGNIHSKLDISV